MTATSKTTKVPKNALRFDSAFQFADQSGNDPALFPISMLGRSAEPLSHWYWGTIVHDMAGFSTTHPTVAIDYRHDDDEPIGFLDQFKADNTGLQVAGNLVSVNPADPEDRVANLKKLSAAGVPFQASIYFEASKLEQVQQGASAEVNGYTIDGPAIIVRQWSLRGMAVCLYGADGRTHSKFSDDESEVPVPCFLTEPTMPTKTLTNKAAAAAAAKKLATKPPKAGKLPPGRKLADGKQADEADEADDEAEDEAADDEAEDEAADDEAEDEADDEAADDEAEADDDGNKKHRAELKRYVDTFGHKNGADWFAAGLDYPTSLAKHCSELSAALAESQAEVAKLAAKLKTTNRGETSPLKFSEDKDAGGKGSATPAKFAHLGDGLGKFAAGIKLPGKN